MTPSLQSQRDNLTIGLFLAHSGFGATLDQILQVALGYSPGGQQSIEQYESRFRVAQQVGRDAFKERRPGYFTFNAMNFGNGFIYKATWYVWTNPQSGQPQSIPLPAGDLASMRRLRDKDLDTRESTTRSIRAAHNIEEQRQALQRQDWPALQGIQSRMIQDGSLGEILSGFYGLPYADIQEVIPDLPNRAMLFQFQRNAQNIQQIERRLRQEHSTLGHQLMNWVMLQTGVPSTAPQLALQQAQVRLGNL